jgi:VanZ family protein
MMRNLIVISAWTCLAIIAYSTLSPIGNRPVIHAGGWLGLLANYDRFLSFALLGSLFYLAYPGQTITVCAIVLGGAVLLELAQALTPDRHARVADAFQKLFGGAIGVTTMRQVAFYKQSAAMRPKRAPMR